MKINGVVAPAGPLVQAAVTIQELGIQNELTWFLFDTGATYTLLAERDWLKRFHISPEMLQRRDDRPTLTAGGSMPSWILPKRTQLTFRSSTNSLYVEHMPNIRVIHYENLPDKKRKELEAVPSILGRDIIFKFKTTLTHKRLEMLKE